MQRRRLAAPVRAPLITCFRVMLSNGDLPLTAWNRSQARSFSHTRSSGVAHSMASILR